MKTRDEVKLRVFDCMFPICEPQSVDYQTRVRAEGNKLMEIAHWYGDEYVNEKTLRKELGILRAKVTRIKKAQEKLPYTNPGEYAKEDGEMNAILWFLGEDGEKQ